MRGAARLGVEWSRYPRLHTRFNKHNTLLPWPSVAVSVWSLSAVVSGPGALVSFSSCSRPALCYSIAGAFAVSLGCRAVRSLTLIPANSPQASNRTHDRKGRCSVPALRATRPHHQPLAYTIRIDRHIIHSVPLSRSCHRILAGSPKLAG